MRAYDPEGRGAEYRLTVDVRRLAKAMEINTLSIVGAVGFVGGRMNVNATIAPTTPRSTSMNSWLQNA